ncbi:hypothetical protein FXO37_06436 [Capsicum annuum]|nr:hypothetical protein FXO37_06436 [Capsicum annuum]
MAGGGDHSHGGDFRTKVWSMSGGPYCRPVHWKRNTAIALAGIVLVCIPVALKSAELEGTVLGGQVQPGNRNARRRSSQVKWSNVE